MLKPLKSLDLVQHKRTLTFYIISSFPKVRLTPSGAWVAGVLYHAADNPFETFVRERTDFEDAFDLVRV